MNKNLQIYTLRFDAFISKNITLQNYTEFMRTNHQFSNWSELEEDGVYPTEESDFIDTGGGEFNAYPIYSEVNINPEENQHPIWHHILPFLMRKSGQGNK